MPASNAKRQELIVTTLSEAFEPLMKADPDGFRTKFRKMAADPFAFYRGSACLFYADMAQHAGAGSAGATTAPAACGSTATCTPRTSAPT